MAGSQSAAGSRPIVRRQPEKAGRKALKASALEPVLPQDSHGPLLCLPTPVPSPGAGTPADLATFSAPLMRL